MRILPVAAAFCIASSSLCAQTVIQNTNLVFGPVNNFPPANYVFTVGQSTAPVQIDYTSVWMKYSRPTLEVTTINIDEGSDWYVVKQGDVFSPENIQAGMFTKLVTFGPVVYPAANVGQSDFWLGVATGHSLSSNRNAFGWAHMQPTTTSPTGLVMVANVMSYNSRGIIVGTTTLVPEPAAIALVAIGLPMLLHRRRK